MGALEAARPLLAAWAAWMPALAAPLAAVTAAALTTVATAVACERRASPDEHWTARARRLYPGRQVASAALLLMPLLLGTTAHLLLGPLSRAPAMVAMATAMGALAGAIPVAFLMERKARPALRPGPWLRALLTLWILVRPVPFVLVFTLIALPWRFDARAAAMLGLAAATILALVAGAGLRLARGLGLVWPAGEKLRAAMAQAEEAVGHRARRAHECAITAAFAAAFPLRNEVVFSVPAVEHLPPDELASVAAHEVGHLAEPRHVVALRALGALLLLPAIAIAPILSSFGLLSYTAVLGVTVVAFVGLLRLVQRMERRADAVAHRHDVAPGRYARALERIYAFNVVPAVIGARGAAHPDLYDRMLAAGVTPDYPRPRRPSSLQGALGFACLILLPILAVDWVGLLPAWLAPPATRRARASPARSGRALELTRLGLARESAGDVPGALSLFEAAAEAEPDKVWPALLLEHALIRHGRCEEALAAEAMVQERLEHEASMLEAAEATRAARARCRPSPLP